MAELAAVQETESWAQGWRQGFVEVQEEWAIASAELSDEAFVTLVTGKPAVRAGRSRATRPSRYSTKRR